MPHPQSALTFYLKPRILLTIILVTLVLSAGLIFSDFFLRIKHVRVLGVSPNVKLRGIELTADHNLLLLNEEKLVKDLQKDNPQIDTIDVKKNYPQTLTLIITYSQPAVFLEVNNGYFLLTKNAKILQKKRQLPQTDLPVIYYYQKLDYESYQAGGIIDYQDIKTGLYFARLVSLAQIPVSRIDIASNDMILCYLKDPVNGKILFSLKKDMNIQSYELQTIIRELKIEGKNFKKIDLRFDKPVITY